MSWSEQVSVTSRNCSSRLVVPRACFQRYDQDHSVIRVVRTRVLKISFLAPKLDSCMTSDGLTIELEQDLTPDCLFMSTCKHLTTNLSVRRLTIDCLGSTESTARDARNAELVSMSGYISGVM